MNITLKTILAKLPIGKLTETIAAHILPLTRLLPDKRLGAVVQRMILGILGGQTPVITGMWIHSATPKWLIEGDDCTEARGERWTEPGFFQGYGPFVMSEWIHDSEITIVKNPFWPGTDAIPQSKLDAVVFSMLDGVAQLADYESGNLDNAQDVPDADIDRIKTDPVLSAEFSIAPQLCTYYYGFNTTAPFVDDVRVRRALSMAIDRQGLIDNVTKGGQEPAQWFARPGLAGAPTMEGYPDLGVKVDAAAKALMDEYLAEKGITADEVDITLMFNTSSGHQRIAEAIQQMWKTNLGLDVKLQNQEWRVYLQTLQEDSPQIWRLGWCSDYPDANNFTKEVFSSGGHEEAATKWTDATFDAILAQAALEPDLAKRTDLYAQAEQILV